MKKKGPRLVALTAYTQYAVVRKVCRKAFRMRLQEEDNTEDFDLLWADHAIAIERLAKLRSHQRCSQMPGIQCMTRKNTLGHNLNAMKAEFGTEYDFYP